MSILVPFTPPELQHGGLRTGAAVRSVDWQAAGAVANHVLGRGMQLVPAYVPKTASVTNTGVNIFRWRVRPRYQALERILFIRLRAASGTADVEVKFPHTGSAHTHRATSDRNHVSTVQIRQRLASQSDSEGDLTLSLEPESGSDIRVDSIAICDIPRAALAEGGDDLGTDDAKVRHGAPGRRSALGSIILAAEDPSLIGRRVLFNYAVPYTVNGGTSPSTVDVITTSSTSFADMHTIPLPFLARKDLRASTTGTVKCAIYARNRTGSSGEARLVSSVNGATSEVAITTTSFAWYELSLTVDCEDLTASDGLQSSTFDQVKLQLRNTAGNITDVASLGCWED